MDDVPEETAPGLKDQAHRTLSQAGSPSRKRIAAIIAAAVGSVVLLAGLYVGYLFAVTPVSIRQPLYEHYHFRMQVLVNGTAENFAAGKYQEGYSKDNCNAALTTHPIHFHDYKDQFVHIHWEGITGGQVMKYYGWNLIGGQKGSLGYRFDTAPKLTNVPVHGDNLPAIPNDAAFYVYTGDAEKYQQRAIDDFKNQDLEKFFGVVSNSPAHQLNKQKRDGLAALLHKLEPTASAHGSEQDGHNEQASAKLTPDELQRLNNLIGNVVIFVQKDKPSDQQVKDRFNKLEPLSDSTCGG